MIAPDLSYVATGTNLLHDVTQTGGDAGTYVVKDGMLIQTMTKSRSTNTNMRLPMVFPPLRIVRIDDRELVVRTEERPSEEYTVRKSTQNDP